jgi:hypothetical protein
LAAGYAAVLLVGDVLRSHSAVPESPQQPQPAFAAALARNSWYWLPPLYGLALVVVLILTNGQDAGAAQFMYRRF